jgi:hypothetical protein
VSSQDITRFQLSLHGIVLELEGERDFVDEMYRDIMRDIEEARARQLSGKPSGLEHVSGTGGLHPPKPSLKPPPAFGHGLDDVPTEVSQDARARKLRTSPQRAEHVVWLHRCSELVHKIYMAAPRDLNKLGVFHNINVSQAATVYIEDGLLSDLLPQFDRGQTLWAELTRAGRKKIAEASLGHKDDQHTKVFKSSAARPKHNIKGTSST